MKDLTNEELPMLLEQPFCIAFSITLPYLLFTAKVSEADASVSQSAHDKAVLRQRSWRRASALLRKAARFAREAAARQGRATAELSLARWVKLIFNSSNYNLNTLT